MGYHGEYIYIHTYTTNTTNNKIRFVGQCDGAIKVSGFRGCFRMKPHDSLSENLEIRETKTQHLRYHEIDMNLDIRYNIYDIIYVYIYISYNNNTMYLYKIMVSPIMVIMVSPFKILDTMVFKIMIRRGVLEYPYLRHMW